MNKNSTNILSYRTIQFVCKESGDVVKYEQSNNQNIKD